MNQDDSHLSINGKKIIIETVKTHLAMERGLSGRDALSENAGMLFFYQRPTTPSFWMKGMKFSIDIIWIGSNKQIVGIEKNVSPDTFPQTFRPESQIQYVLEVPAGFSAMYGIVKGQDVVF